MLVTNWGSSTLISIGSCFSPDSHVVTTLNTIDAAAV